MSKYSKTEAVLINLARLLKIQVTTKTLTQEVKNHTDPDTLLCLSDILNQFNVLNFALSNLSTEQLLSIPCPFVAHISHPDKNFVIINSITNNEVVVDGKVKSFKEFEVGFDGVILFIQPTEHSGDANYHKNKQQQLLNSLRIPIVIIGLTLVLILTLSLYSPYFYKIKWEIILLTIFKILGLITSVLLLIQSIDANNPLIQRLCQSENNKDCNAILSSKAAVVFEGLNWSEVGYFYFAGSCLTLLFNSNSISALQILSLLNILSLPYTFYSIYYQARIAKQWCIFCCTIQLLLWLEFYPLFLNLEIPLLIPSMKVLGSLAISFISPFIFWIWNKPFYLGAQKIVPLNKQVNKFKYNIDLFNKLLTEQAKYVIPDDSWSIVLGKNKNPEAIITMVSNPYCGPCSKAHETLEHILQARKNIQINFVFVFNKLDSEDDKRMIVARQLLALNKQSSDPALIKSAINDWYNQKQKNFEEWSNKYPVKDDENIRSQLQSHLEWIELTNIRSTPTILMNGYKLPYPYELADLKYL